MNIDWTLDVGNVVTLLTIGLTIIYKLTKIENKVDIMWLYFTKNFERRKQL